MTKSYAQTKVISTLSKELYMKATQCHSGYVLGRNPCVLATSALVIREGINRMDSGRKAHRNDKTLRKQQLYKSLK